MNGNDFITRLRRAHGRLNGCTVVYDLKPYRAVLEKINAAGREINTSCDEKLKELSSVYRNRIVNGESPDLLLPQCYALVKEAVKRTMGIEPFDEQIMGAIALHEGKIAEMKTGEGKTLTIVFAAYLNALCGKGVHVLTFNDYLAGRDASWMKPVYEFLGLTVGCVREGMAVKDRRVAYNRDITYLTAKEAGFDYLRDDLCYRKENVVHRGLEFAIIDEADSILIDEARSPLVIAGEIDACTDTARQLTPIAGELEAGSDFEADEYCRNVFLTEKGIDRVEKRLGCGNLFEEKNHGILVGIEHAVHARHLLKKDKDYIVRDGRVELIDEFTGRVAHKRRWPDGLQAAVEAKENCLKAKRGAILNSIPLQHFVRLYSKISGLTATAQASEEEFREFYNLHIVVIPPHRQCIRIDLKDVLFATKKEKLEALLAEIESVHAGGRPVLVGTQSVKESVELSDALAERGIECTVLNAKQDECEAMIIARAGSLGAVTISTNMAGRGTDICLGGNDEKEREKVAGLGGLYVMGTNRHESRRIDDQLRGRAGRQGDPGRSRFFISMEDDLFERYRLKELLPREIVNNIRSGRLENPILTKEIDRVQRIIGGQSLDIKITLFKYSLMLEQQRKLIREKRRKFLFGGAGLEFYKSINSFGYDEIVSKYGKEKVETVCREICLGEIDREWSDYLAEISDIRENIHLRRLGGQNPLFEFRTVSIELFDILMGKIDSTTEAIFSKLSFLDDGDGEVERLKAPDSTWTYLVTDDPFEHDFGIKLLAETGTAAWEGLLWPITVTFLLVKRIWNRFCG